MRNLLKYDFKYTWRVWWIGAVASVITAIFGIISLKHIYNNTYVSSVSSSAASVIDGLSISGIAAFIIVLVAFYLLIELIVMFRYYKNFFTDEGYLTFTLPVTEKTHLLSKTISGYLWIIATCIAIAILVGTFGIFEIGYQYGFEKLGEMISEIIASYFEDFGTYAVWYIVELILLCLVGIMVNVQLGYISITIGSIIAKKNKLLAGIGVYFAISIAFSIISNVVTFMGVDELTNDAFYNHADRYIALGLGGMIVFLAAICVAAYLINLSLLRKKLNLA